jgi:FkbM family methyltransferase
LSVSHGRGGQRPSIDVEVRALDDAMAELGVDSVAFIKIDAEGAEGNILRSAVGTLETHRPYVLVESMDPTNDVVIGDILSDHAYRR